MTSRGLLGGVVCGLVAAFSFAQSAGAAQYVIEPARSALVVQLFKAGVGAALAHDHVVHAVKYSGRIQLDPAMPTAAQITVEVDATALVADEPETRQRYNLPLGLGEESRREIQETLESEGQLYVQRYPRIRFRSTRVAVAEEGRYLVSGDLELRGVTQTISVSLEAELQGEELHGKGTSRFLQSSFGYQPYSAFWGAVQNQDEVILHVDIVAIRQ